MFHSTFSRTFPSFALLKDISNPSSILSNPTSSHVTVISVLLSKEL